MKKSRKIAKNPYMAVILSGLILFTVSCKKEPTNQTASKYANYTGEDIFEGLFFFQNELSDDVSHIKELKFEMNNLKLIKDVKLPNLKNEFSEEEIKTSIKEMSEITVLYITENYPTFFKEFEDVMKSGNFYEMERVMDLSSQLIDQSLLASSKYRGISLLNKELNDNPELREQILSLDMTKAEDIQTLETILSSAEGLDGEVHKKALVAVLAVAYIAVGVVSFVVAAYSVVTKIAYWDPTSSMVTSIQKEKAIVNISQVLSLRTI
jgi:hypothetical protein